MRDSENFKKCVQLVQNTSITIKGKGTFSLTKRESECILLAFKGKSCKEIGKLLGISPRTIEAHLYNIKNKTNSRNKATIIDFFYTHFGKCAEFLQSDLI